MSTNRVDVGLVVPPNGKPRELNQLLGLTRLSGGRTLLLWDHWQDFYPRWLWSTELSWFAEDRSSPHEYLDVFTALGYLAGRRTGRVRIGTGVTETLRRHPVAVAQAALTLSHLARQSPIIGIGAGERENTEPYGIPFEKPVSRLEEAIHIIKACWDETRSFDYDGDHFQLDGAVMDLVPPAGREPELWLASHGPRMLQLTGRYADGWFPTFEPDPVLYEQKREKIESAAIEGGRNLETFTWSLQAPLVLAPTDEEAESVLRESLAARYIAVAAFPAEMWERVGADHPFGPEWRGIIDVIPEELEQGDLRSAMDNVPFEIIRQGAIWGSVKTVVDKVQKLGQAGLNHIAFIPSSAAESKRLFRYFGTNLWRITRRLR